ncbi:MAG: glycosyltransferase family 25 protein [Simkaniaceae bacterium]|nr:glycosyltransferase family 25 protein [Simkaniaceae bacterium]MCF7852661.1 glycosyltransferase family 25 protein [Simkaniaceae bacterium]
MKKGLHRFDAILYINLAHRQDRKKRVLSNLQKANVNMKRVIRIDACPDALNGHRGCALSHIKALQFAITKKYQNALILEDDFVFHSSSSEIEHYVETFFDHFKSNWDVFLLSSNVIEYEATSHSNIKRVLCAQTAHSYAVNQHYFPILLKNFEFALSLMKDDIFFFQTGDNTRAIDQIWKLLQPHGKWYIGEKTIGKQGASFSDIEIDHIKRFMPECYS